MKTRIFFISLILLLAAWSINAQDTIYFKTSDRVVAIITEITENTIRYKEYSYPDGPDYLMNVNSVEKIAMKNGDIKMFSNQMPMIPFERNIISMHVFDLVYKDFTISYEHIIKNGKLGIKIPVSIGINPYSGYDGPRDYLNVFYSGIGVNAYLLGQRMASYFVGTEVHFGSGLDQDDYWDEYNGYHESRDVRFFYGRFLVNNGISFTPIPAFRLAGVMGFGLRYYNAPNAYGDGLKPTFYWTLSMGYRF